MLCSFYPSSLILNLLLDIATLSVDGHNFDLLGRKDSRQRLKAGTK